MTYSNINNLVSPLTCSSSNHPIISYSTYIRNKYDNFDCNYWKRHLYDKYGLSNDKYDYLSEIYNNYKVEISSAIYNQIEIITNKYFADKRIYISGIIPKSYYCHSRGNSKSIRELCYFIKLISDSEKSQFPYNPYSEEYTAQNYKSDMKNLYKRLFLKRYLTHNQEEMSCLNSLPIKNNTNKKFHK